MFNTAKKVLCYGALTLSAALTAGFVFYGFINTDAVEYQTMQSRINVVVSQLVGK